MNRVSTFTGNRNVVNKPTASSDEHEYEKPFNMDYLHPLPDSVPEEPPPLPERTIPIPEEPHYEEPDEIRQPKNKEKSKKNAGNKAREKNSGTTDTHSDADKAVRSTANAAPPKPTSAPFNNSLPSNSMPVESKASLQEYESMKSPCSPVPLKSNATLQKNESMKPPSSPLPVKSSATVHRNESMKSVTIRTEVDGDDSIACPNILGSSLVGAADEGFQITLTLRSKPKFQPPLESSYMLMN